MNKLRREDTKQSLATLSERIVSRRKSLGLKQYELSAETGIVPSAMNAIESGKSDPSLNTLIRIAGVLKVSVGYLLGERDDFSNAVPDRYDRKLLRDYHSLKTQYQELIRVNIKHLKKNN